MNVGVDHCGVQAAMPEQKLDSSDVLDATGGSHEYTSHIARFWRYAAVVDNQMNPIGPRMSTGVAGELLVQIRLLQYKVQAAPPVEDTGNDLIAVNGNQALALSVRTTTTGRFRKPDRRRSYHALAVVHMQRQGQDLHLDQTEIYLIPFDEVALASTDCTRLAAYRFSKQQVERIFGPVAA